MFRLFRHFGLNSGDCNILKPFFSAGMVAEHCQFHQPNGAIPSQHFGSRTAFREVPTFRGSSQRQFVFLLGPAVLGQNGHIS